MKIKYLSVFVFAFLAFTFGLQAQSKSDVTSTSTPITPASVVAAAGSPIGGLITKGEEVLHSLATATNWAVSPYATIGSRSIVTGKTKSRAFGGGILAVYNFNQYIGGGMGIDELGGLDQKGQLTLVSANVELQLPMQPLAFTKTSFGTNLTLTPFIYSGIGTPLGGGATVPSSAVVHEGEGINIDAFSLWGGKIGGGVAYIQRQNAGVYSGNYWNPFICWHTSF